MASEHNFPSLLWSLEQCCLSPWVFLASETLTNEIQKRDHFFIFSSYFRACQHTRDICVPLQCTPEFSLPLFSKFVSCSSRSTLMGPFSLNSMSKMQQIVGDPKEQTLRPFLSRTLLQRQVTMWSLRYMIQHNDTSDK